MKRLLLLLLFTALPLVAQRAIVLDGATMIDGIARRPVPDVVIVIEGGMITGVGKKEFVIIPPNAQRIDLRGKFVMPGLIDAHIHYGGERDLLRLLAWGVTSANCMFESPLQGRALEIRTAADTAIAPRIFAAAPIFTAPHGWWTDGVPSGDLPADTAVNRIPGSPEEARAQVRRTKALGISRIKIMYDSMGWCRDPLPRLERMDPGIMKALVGEAAAQGMMSEIHAPISGDAAEAQDAGVSAFLHGVIDERLTAPFVGALQQKAEFYVPTFCLYEFLADARGFVDSTLADPRFRAALAPAEIGALTAPAYAAAYHERYPNAAWVKSRLPIGRENFKTVVDNYGNIAMGTDMWVFPGIAAHIEMEEMVKAGLTPMQSLAAATSYAGQFIGTGERIGSIYIGARADLIILDADPSADIRNTRTVSTIIKGGRVYRHDDLVKRSLE
jgi:imidazolonepropionase-like amidohydrolase